MNTLQSKFATFRQEMAAALIEREAEIDLCLTSLLCQEHVLLVGMPGTAKSMLANNLVKWINGTQFTWLLTKFTAPEEIVGPVSLQGLKQDVYRRIVTGKLPEANVAFLDEIFKASSAILNTMLTLLNERTFQNDGTLLHCPLLLAIGASNEWPGDNGDGKELGALFDRFLFRKLVKPISADRGLDRLLWTRSHAPAISGSITVDEIKQAHREAMALPIPDETKAAFLQIVKEARTEGIVAGDRRLYKAVGATQAFAYLDGASEVKPDHLEILSHVLWADPQEQPRKLEAIVGRIANPAAMAINGYLTEAEQIISGLANAGDAAQAIPVCRKLAEIHGKLKGLKHAKAEAAAKFVASEVTRIKLASL